MIIKQLVEEDFVNYKDPAMFIAFPKCSFKCEKEFGVSCCQNSMLALAENINVSVVDILERYMANPITSAIVLGGLEPFDSAEDVIGFISYVRHYIPDPIVIYTGYTEDEVKKIKAFDENLYSILALYENVIVKFGRYIPDQELHFDEVLGVKLASDNQYAKYIGEPIEIRSLKK